MTVTPDGQSVPEQGPGGGPAGRAPSGAPTMDAVVRSLAALRRSAWSQLLAQRLGVGLAILVACAILIGLLDYALRMPAPLRVVLWLAGVAWAAWFVVARLVPAWRFRPSLTDVALRLESTLAAREAGLEGRLASGIELSREQSPSGPLAELASLSAREAARRFGAMGRSAGLLDRRRLAVALGALGLASLPLALLATTAPSLTQIGFQRVVLPWTSAAWPKRTRILSAGHAEAHARGTPLALRALLARSPREPGQTQVEARYRTTINDIQGPWRKAVLTWQGRRASAPSATDSTSEPAEGELFEMLLDPGVPAGSDASQSAVLEYAFASGDDETPVTSVLLIEPPAIEAASVEITPPQYAASVLAPSAPGTTADWTIGTVDIARATDQRSRVGPVLAGSRVTLTLDLNKPLTGPIAGNQLAWLRTHMPALAQLSEAGVPVSIEARDRRWQVAFTPTDTIRIAIQPIDEHGITSREEHSVSLQIAPDAPPSAAIIEPPSDESVLPTAVVEVVGEGRDDVSLAGVRLRSVLARPPTGSAGAAPEPTQEWEELAAAAPGPASPSDKPAAATTLLRASATLDIGATGAASGDEVWVRVGVRDILGVSTEAPEILSLTRRLRVISEAEFVEQVRSEMSNLRESAKRLAEAQEALGRDRAQATSDTGAAAQQAQAQEALGERLPPMAEVTERLLERVERNRLEDPSLRGMLTDAKDVIGEAREASDNAAAALSALSSEAPPSQREEAAQEAQQSQARAQEALEELASMLDRGQDSWAVRRELERLMTEQRQVASQTAAAGEPTRGRTQEELTPAEREDLDRVARRQDEVAQRTAGLIEQMEARAAQLSQSDPGQAEAMRRAAQKARNERLAERQREAAEKTRQNQTGAAQQQQQQAQEALEEMMEELERSDQRQDEALRRTLADLEDSIQKLITQQEGELARLAPAIAGAAASGLDAGMIALHQNTLDVLGKAEAGQGPGVAKIGELLDRASQSQSAATVSLRAGELVEAEAHERNSLARLRDALAEVRKQEEQAQDRDDARKRAQLRKAYQELLEQQVAIQTETGPLVGRELSRRERSQARALGERQAAIATALEQLRSTVQEVAESQAFELANRRLDDASRRAGATLSAGDATRAVARDQTTAVRILQGLVEALRDPKKSDEFREEQGGGGGGGGGGGEGQKPPLIPPIAELRLLRSMQAEAADLTRAAAEGALGPEGADASADLDAAADLQAELAEQAQILLKKLSEESAPQVPPGPPDAAEPAKPEPAPGGEGATP